MNPPHHWFIAGMHSHFISIDRAFTKPKYRSDMEACYNCVNINLEDDGYALTTISTLRSKADEGCPGCKFFSNTLGESERANAHGDAEVRLQRVSDEDNRVLLWLMNNDEELDRIMLRLCSPYGYEPLPYAEDEGEHVGLGRLISAHSGDPQCLNLAKEWFHRCVHSHGKACALGEDVQLPKRLVYVPPDPNERLRVCVTEGLRGQYYSLIILLIAPLAISLGQVLMARA